MHSDRFTQTLKEIRLTPAKKKQKTENRLTTGNRQQHRKQTTGNRQQETDNREQTSENRKHQKTSIHPSIHC